MRILDKIVLTLIIVGGLNWGLLGLFNFNLVNAIFGDMTIISRLVYTLVGLSAIWAIKFYMSSDEEVVRTSSY